MPYDSSHDSKEVADCGRRSQIPGGNQRDRRPKNDPSLKELCVMASGAVEFIRGEGPGTGLPPEARDAFSKLNAMQRKDMEQQFGALKETCSTKNLDGMRRFVRLGIEKDSRTCLVSTNRFEQVFRPVKDLDGKLLSWTVADTAPQGDCVSFKCPAFVQVIQKANRIIRSGNMLQSVQLRIQKGTTFLAHAKISKKSRPCTTGTRRKLPCSAIT